jgi:hypothetical protein
MEHVNNDMDDLFRKAGELYPLKTSESDWDGVLGKLRDEISGETGIPYTVPVRGNSNRRKWLLLVLVPAFIFSLVYLTGSRFKENKTQLPGKNKNLPANKSSPVASKISSSTEQPENETTAGSKSQLNKVQDVRATAVVSKKSVVAGKVSQDAALYQSASIQNKNLTDPESFHEPVEKAVSLSVYGPRENPSVYGMPFPPLVLKNVALNSETAATVAKTKTNKSGLSKGIYAVLLGGPDFSTVSFQAREQAGYSLGILLGYRFNKRLSIETGLLWDKKNYNSSGEYFDKSKTTISANVDILKLDGYCNMFEIPLNFRYDFATSKNHSFFAAAGLSSYLMKKEYYTYTYGVYNPMVMPYTGGTYGKPYYNGNNYILSIFQMSAGYEYAVGVNTKIRIEPYMKIPLQGIGIGNMRVSSVGLYFGISHSFH